MNRIIVIVVLIYISGCGTDNEATDPEPVKENFYTIEAAADLKTTDTDDWVLASDASGKWLDVQPYEAGQTILLKARAPLPQAVNLTFLSVSGSPMGPRFDFKTYTEMPVNGTWNIKPFVYTPLVYNSIGNATINVKNFNGDFQYINLSSIEGNVGGNRSMIGNEVTMNVTLFKSPSDLVFSFREGNDYKSTVIKDVNVGSTVTFDAIDMHPPEMNYRFTFPNNTFYYIGFYGYKPGDDPRHTGYILSQHIDNDGGVPGLLLGYDTGYEKYKSIVSYSTANYSRAYYRFGAPMEDYPDFSNPSPTHSGTLKNFSWNPGMLFSLSSAFFHDPVAKNVTWEIISKKGQGLDLSVSFEQFPSQLRDVYTTLNVDDIMFLKADASLYLDEFTYDDFIKLRANSGNPLKSNSDEYYYYGWNAE